MDFQIIPAENNQVVSLELAKKHLRLDSDEEDILVDIAIASAQEMAESNTGRAVGLRNLIVTSDKFESFMFEMSSNDKIEKVEYYLPDSDQPMLMEDTAYSMIKFGIETFEVKFKEPFPQLEKRNDALKVTISQGYTAENCPKPIISAILLMLADSFEKRENRGEIGNNSASSNLLRPFRKWH